MIRRLWRVYRGLSTEKQRRAVHDLWPSWVGIFIILFGLPVEMIWGRWAAVGVDGVALCFIGWTGCRVLPQVNAKLTEAERNRQDSDPKPGET